MPVQHCWHDTKPGYRWGEHGKCYTYKPSSKRSRAIAYAKAARQGRAIKARQTRTTVGGIFGGDPMNERLGNRFRSILLAAVGLPGILKLLQAVTNPSDELKTIIKRVEKIIKNQEAGEKPGEYGHVVDVKALEGILKALNALDDKPAEVEQAIKELRELLGEDENSKPPLGNLPGYGVSEIKGSQRPGTYRARLIRAGDALNGLRWTEDALKQAVDSGLFEGVPINVITYTGRYGDVDYHLADESLAGQIVGNQVGFVKDATWDPNDRAVYATAWITDTDRRSLIDTIIEQGAKPIGLSIYATGLTDENNNVLEITDVGSMDMVTFPAADGAIVERLTAALKKFRIEPILGAGEVSDKVDQGDNGQKTDVKLPDLEPQPQTDTSGDKVTGMVKDAYLDRISAYVKAALGDEHSSDVDAIVAQVISDTASYVSQNIESGDLVSFIEKAGYYYAMGKANTAIAEYFRTHSNEEPQKQEGNNQPTSEGAESSNENNSGDQSNESKLGGGSMDAKTVAMIGNLHRRLSELEGRVREVDSDEYAAQQLTASGLPKQVQELVRQELRGKDATAEEIDGVVQFTSRLAEVLEAGLVSKAGVHIDGEPAFEDKADINAVEAELNKLLGLEE